MAAPFNNLRSKTGRAIAAWLIAQNAGTIADTFPDYTQAERAYPSTTVKVVRGMPDPPLTGNYRCTVRVSIKGSAAKDANDPGDPGRVAFDARVASVIDALLKSDDDQTFRAVAGGVSAAGRALAVPANQSPDALAFAQQNADMVDFTCGEWNDMGFGEGAADAEGCSWEEVVIFEAVTCAANVD